MILKVLLNLKCLKNLSQKPLYKPFPKLTQQFVRFWVMLERVPATKSVREKFLSLVLTLSLIFQLKHSQIWSACGCNRGELLLELLVEKIYPVIVGNNVIFLTQTITKVCLTYSHLLLLSFLAETRSVSCLLTKPNEVIVLT